MPVLAAVLIASAVTDLQGSLNAHRVDLKVLQARREWLFNQTHDREDSGYFDDGEASPNGIFFPAGESDKLFYLSMSSGEKPGEERYHITCWARHGDSAKRMWLVKLLPGVEPVKGTLLREACDSPLGKMTSRLDPKTGKWIDTTWDVKGFHPDRKASEWFLAKDDLEMRQTFVHYHFSWHGDPSLGSYLDMHGDMNVGFGFESLNRGGPPMVIPRAEIKWLKKNGRL